MSKFDRDFLPIVLDKKQVYGEDPNFEESGLNNLPSFLRSKPDNFDSNLKLTETLLTDPKIAPDITKIYDKPRLDNEVIEKLKEKINLQIDYDFENFVTDVMGSTSDRELYFLQQKFPDIIKRKEIPPLAKIELHNKIAKLIIKGLKNEEDYILTYLISKNHVPVDSFLLTTILTGIGYTSRDQLNPPQGLEKFLDFQQELGKNREDRNFPIRLSENEKNPGPKDHRGPPKREPMEMDPYKNLKWDIRQFKDEFRDNKSRWSEKSLSQHNFFGSGKYLDDDPQYHKSRYTNNWFLNLR